MPKQNGEYCLRFSYQALRAEFYPISVPITLKKLGRICTIRQKTTILQRRYLPTDCQAQALVLSSIRFGLNPQSLEIRPHATNGRPHRS
ncbi:hypothetical protein NSND_62678 [Nitrospira sp. ND1]|nr:hypothetical protein NSND_62678 [Nitrospira sp. ND1]